MRIRPLRIAYLGSALALGACGVPGVRGVRGTSPAPQVPWTPPAPRRNPPAPIAPLQVPPDLAQRIAQLRLADVLDLALRNNTSTRAAWADARSAAYAYGAAQGQYFPSIDLTGTATTLKTVPSQGRSAVRQSVYGPTLNLTWLLLDFGGRGGAIATARDALLAADWTHNAVIQDVVLGVETAFFRYVSTRALLVAQRTTLTEADSNLIAAKQRHDVGLATIADVLQAQTARSQAELNVETTSGALQTARGALAVSMGYPANLPYDIDSLPLPPPPPAINESVDSLIARAVASRPDLAAARADADAARARVSIARGAALPSLLVTGTAGETYFANRAPVPGNSYTLSVGLQVPLFAGGAHVNGVRGASAAADAAAARAEGFAQQVVYQVFTSYYALQTASQRVRTSDDLLASARQSEQVALGRYRAGAGSVLDLLSAEGALADARAQQVDAHFSWTATLAQLAHDVGILGIDGSSPLRFQTDTTGTH
ncbi:MAG TPA: TolC family protein [Gemmatimonadales bacterium]|nr:TolC family protein [Gemmatimonadales bacterium]